MSAFAAFRANLSQELVPVLEEASQPVEIAHERMVALVEGVMDRLGRAEPGEPSWRTEVRRSTIDRTLEDSLIKTALERSEANEDHFEPVTNVLDLILTFSELDYCDTALPLVCLGNLLELETISTCQKLFDYIERKRDRITKDMLPNRGKSPVLLRMLNELLRRLPKSKPEHVVFSGRILMFLSSVFPLGEKSGVNLRGNFNTGKETVFEEVQAGEEEGGEESVKSKAEGDSTEDFYTTFWSLQRFFNNPPLLFANPAPVASTSTSATLVEPFAVLRQGLTKTLDEFALATKKERELSGKAAKEGKKKASSTSIMLPEVAAEAVMSELEEDGEQMDHYFFPKFLTSPNLLELELADPAFRRQILVQTLILAEYLLACTPAARAKVQPTTTNPAALSPFVLSAENEKWIEEIKDRALEELGKMDRGSYFKETVQLILARDQNWITWKLQACVPFEKPAVDPLPISDKARSQLAIVTRKPKAFPYKLGNPTLSRLWEKNLTSLDEFDPPRPENSLDGLIRKWSMANRALVAKRKQLSTLPPGNAQRATLEGQIEQLDIKAKALHWRATREAAKTHLHLFARIKAGDLDLLMGLMDEERRKEEEEEEEREAQEMREAGGEVKMEGAEEVQKGESEESEVLLGTGGQSPEPVAVDEEVKAEDETMKEADAPADAAPAKASTPEPKPIKDEAEPGKPIDPSAVGAPQEEADADNSTTSTSTPAAENGVDRPLTNAESSTTDTITAGAPSSTLAGPGAGVGLPAALVVLVPDEVRALMRGGSPQPPTPTTPKRPREASEEDGEGEQKGSETKKARMEVDEE